MLSADSAQLRSENLPKLPVFIGAKMELSRTNLSLTGFASISTSVELPPENSRVKHLVPNQFIRGLSPERSRACCGCALRVYAEWLAIPACRSIMPSLYEAASCLLWRER